MDIRDEFYYVRQHRMLSNADLVPAFACPCGESYYPRLKDGTIWAWCMVDDYWIEPSKGQMDKIVKEVKEIEG